MTENPIPRDMTYQEIRDAVDALEGDISFSGMARDLEVSPTAVYDTARNRMTSDRIRRHIAKCINMPVETVWPQTYLTKKNPTRKGRPRSRGLYTGNEAAA